MKQPAFEWPDKVVVLTGAASGIGRALALRLARTGAHLALSDIQADPLKTAAVEARSAGAASVRSYVLDVGSRAALTEHTGQVLADFGRVNALINNAGVSLTCDATEQSLEDIDWLLNVNLHGVITLSQLLLPHLIASGSGCLVNLSSVFGIIGVPGQSAYSAAKFGVRGYTEAVAMEMHNARHPVSVHCVHPGAVDTNIVKNGRLAGDLDADILARQFQKMAKTSADGAAEQILAGVARGKTRILVGRDAKVIHTTANLLGARYQGLVARTSRKLMKRQ